MRRNKARRAEDGGAGFTLLELMVAVVIVVILSTIAVIAYVRHLRQGRIVEARAFISSIASRQESYFQRYGYYCDVSGSSDAPYPPLVSGSEPVSKAWAPDTTSGWASLNVRPEKESTYFQFTVRASDPNASHALVSRASSLGIPSVTSGGTPFPWYYVYAEADFDGSGSPYTTLYSTSVKSEIITLNEGQ